MKRSKYFPKATPQVLLSIIDTRKSMKNMKVLGSVSTILLACVTARAAEDCSSNFAAANSLAPGIAYNISEVFATVAPHQAFKRILAATAENGFTVEVSNEDAGLILASERSLRAHSSVASLNVTVKPEASGSRVIITYVTPEASKYHDKAVKLRLCNTMEAISQP